MNESEAKDMLAILKAAFPSAAVLPQTAKAYALGLLDMTADQIGAALPAVIQSHALSTLPTVAEIRAAVRATMPPEPMVPELPAGETERPPKLLYRIIDEETGDFIELDPPRVLMPELAAERRAYWFGDAR